MGVNPRDEADLSAASIAKVKNGRAVLPLPICLHGMCLIKYRDNFTLLLLLNR
jgi:hypothetical protein